MKDIKKYFDNFLKDIKEFSKEITNENDNHQSQMAQGDKSEQFQKVVKKTYQKIQGQCSQIDSQLTLIFKEFNELALIHESKLGHSMKDMQQFLEFQQSSDEQIKTVLSKLDMLIEIQEKKMQIEIFGEHPLNVKHIKKLVKKHEQKTDMLPPDKHFSNKKRIVESEAGSEFRNNSAQKSSAKKIGPSTSKLGSGSNLY